MLVFEEGASGSDSPFDGKICNSIQSTQKETHAIIKVLVVTRTMLLSNPLTMLTKSLSNHTYLVVAANNENDTCFWNGLVRGIADCINYAGLDKILQKSLTCQFGPLPDTLQAGACIFPPFPMFICATNFGSQKLYFHYQYM